MSEPIRLEDLQALIRYSTRGDHLDGRPLAHRSATAADLVEALQAEGYVVIGRDENGAWPGWCYGFHPTVEFTLIDKLDALASVQEATTNQSQSDAELVVQEDR